MIGMAMAAMVGLPSCSLFENERVGKGRALYRHYCMHCHGEHGRQNEGFNWMRMPDPRPKDLSAKSEMSTFSDEEIFHTIYRDMKDTTPEIGETIGDDEFAVPTMPTFKYTLSQDEIWSIVAFVRTLHGMSLTHKVEDSLKPLQDRVVLAQEAFDRAKVALDAAVAKADAAADAAEEAGLEEELEEEDLPEEAAMETAEVDLAEAKAAVEGFLKRPRQDPIPRPDLTVTEEERAELIKVGARLFENKYGCNGCHSLHDQGGIVGPPFDRVGFRLNGTWVYRWIKYPQAMKKKTRMPNMGISDADARAITMYLGTLRAPKPTEPAPPPA